MLFQKFKGYMKGYTFIFDNGYRLSIGADEGHYRIEEEGSVEVALINPDGEFSRVLFPKDHDDDVIGWVNGTELLDMIEKANSLVWKEEQNNE